MCLCQKLRYKNDERAPKNTNNELKDAEKLRGTAESVNNSMFHIIWSVMKILIIEAFRL